MLLAFAMSGTTQATGPMLRLPWHPRIELVGTHGRGLVHTRSRPQSLFIPTCMLVYIKFSSPQKDPPALGPAQPTLRIEGVVLGLHGSDSHASVSQVFLAQAGPTMSHSLHARHNLVVPKRHVVGVMSGATERWDPSVRSLRGLKYASACSRSRR